MARLGVCYQRTILGLGTTPGMKSMWQANKTHIESDRYMDWKTHTKQNKITRVKIVQPTASVLFDLTEDFTNQ